MKCHILFQISVGKSDHKLEVGYPNKFLREKTVCWCAQLQIFHRFTALDIFKEKLQAEISAYENPQIKINSPSR